MCEWAGYGDDLQKSDYSIFAADGFWHSDHLYPVGKDYFAVIKYNRIPGHGSRLTWIIHEPRLLQMRGVIHAAVVLHRKRVTTKQPTHPTQPSWLARRVKNADAYKKTPLEIFFHQCQDKFLVLLKKEKHRHFL